MEPVILRGEPPKAASYGSGDGYGYGSGYGSGYGYGYGSGYGSGDGSGDGYGYGYGDGSGDGYGYGYGSGYGYGYGDGSGSGDGYGDGSKEYWLATIPHFAKKWPPQQQERLATLQAEGATLAFWLSDNKGQSSNGGRSIELAAPGVVHKISGPLKLCGPGALHATLIPSKWKGERWWIVALTGQVIWEDDKCGALEREILGEAL
jgi:hypothetical protein